MNNQQTERKQLGKGYLFGAIAAMALGTAVQAAPQIELVNMTVNPITPGIPELVLQNGVGGLELIAGAGAQGNGDGKAAAQGISSGTPGGLNINTPVLIPTINGFNVEDYGGVTAGTQTSFFDVSLEITGMKATGTEAKTILIAGTPPFIPDVASLTQKFEVATFTLYTTYRDDNTSLDRQVLLTGEIHNGLVIAIEPTANAFVNGHVHYTGGAIYDKWTNAGGLPDGGISWSLTKIGGSYVSSGGGTMNPFQADMTGLFTAVVPEPASLSLLALSGVGLLGRFRKQKTATK